MSTVTVFTIISYSSS